MIPTGMIFPTVAEDDVLRHPARGQFFVYVVDCSGSMLDDDRLTRATIELRRSVMALAEPQKFEVIFYNNESIPMPGGPRPRTADLQAKTQLLAWLRLIEPDGGTDPRPAMKQAISFKPDAVFLLSDGEFPEGTVDEVAKLNTRKIPIHCVDLAGGLAGDHLKRIAVASGGQYASRPGSLHVGPPSRTDKTMIDPRVASGLRDLTPAVMIPRERMLGLFRQTFASFGFLPIETPHIERMEVLTGKGAGSDEVLRQIFEVTNKGGTPGELALRFDLTVPLARFVAKHIDELGTPFKRYAIGSVFRGERPAKGRFREFVQCDFDTIGTESPWPTPRRPRSSTPRWPLPACPTSRSRSTTARSSTDFSSRKVCQAERAGAPGTRQAGEDRPRRGHRLELLRERGRRRVLVCQPNKPRASSTSSKPAAAGRAS